MDAEVVAVEKSKVVRSPIVRAIYFVLGLISLLGAFLSWLPGIPTGDLFFLAAFFFARSSDRFHNWLVNHRVFGKIIASYQGGGMSVRAKTFALVGIVGSIAASIIFLIDNTPLRIVVGVVGAYAVWFVLSRPTIRREPTAIGI